MASAHLQVLSEEEAVGGGGHPEVVQVVAPRPPLPHLHAAQPGGGHLPHTSLSAD